MSKHTATFSLNGTEILSYVADRGRVLSPSTIPWQIMGDLATLCGLGHEAPSVGSGQMTTTRMSEHVFQQRADVTVSAGRRVEPTEPGYAGPNHWTYVDVPSVVVQWVGTADYTD